MCVVPGCSRRPVKPGIRSSNLPRLEQQLCSTHLLAIKSGRVGQNWKRDIHNFHRKGHCEWCGKTAGQFADEVIATRTAAAKILGGTPKLPTTIREKIALGMQMLTGDHIKGRLGSKAHHKDNIQTLCFNCHRVKSVAYDDHSGYKSKRKK